jgi:hypothetical protein
VLLTCQDLAATVEEEDVAKLTGVVREFDSITPLVLFLSLKSEFLSFPLSGFWSEWVRSLMQPEFCRVTSDPYFDDLIELLRDNIFFFS